MRTRIPFGEAFASWNMQKIALFTPYCKLTTLMPPAMTSPNYRSLISRLALLCAAVLTFTTQSVTAQSSVPPATQSQTSAAQPLQAKPSTAKSGATAASVPLTIEFDSLKVRFENDGTATRQFDVRVKAGTDEGVSELKTLSFDYDSQNEKFSLAFVRVTKANGTTVEAKPDALTDDLAPAAKNAPQFSELREAHVTVPAMSPGDTLSYEIAISIVKPPAPGEFWFSHNFLSARPAIDEELEINLPAARVIHFQSASQFPPKISTVGDRKIYSWKRLNALPTGDGQVTSNKVPDVTLTSFANWDAIAKWFASMESNATAAASNFTDKSKDLIAAKKTDADKIETLYEYVAKQIHLLSIPAEQSQFQIRPSSKVLDAGYGDDFDKCALLVAMLGANGFDASLALLPTEQKFASELPWPGAIARTVVFVTQGKDTFWMDPAADTLPYRLLLPNSRGKSALIASSKVASHFADTPSDPPFPSTQNVEISGTVTSLGKLTARISYTLRGDNEYALRTAFARTPQSEWNSVAQTMATLDGLHGTVTGAKPSDPTATRDPFVLDFTLVSVDFLDWSQKQLRIPLPLPALGLPDASVDSSKPVELGSPLTVTEKLTLKLPVNDVVHAPVGAAVKRDYAEYRSDYAAQEHTLTVQRTLRFMARELPSSGRDDFQTFATAVQSDESQPIVVENMIPGVPDEASPSELMQAGAWEIRDNHFSNALQLFQQVAQLNPRQANLWLSMGTAQMGLGKYDDAITSFQKLLQADPKNESVNTPLGVAFYNEKKYDQAEAAFQHQIALKPLDSDAYTYLGTVYIDEKKFDKAKESLEKAEVISPSSSAIPLRLGQAELGLGKTDVALAEFEKASTLSPSPLVANDIAYLLADHKAALDRAKEYADAAVDPTENGLSQINLRHVTTNQLVAESELPAFWDTLGWVYFQQGKTEQAESFIEAAWRLNQSPDTGDHLGQIYEARGQKELAIRAYTLSLAADPSSQNTRDRLKKLLASTPDGSAATGSQIDARVKRAAVELARERTISLGHTTLNGKAEVVVLIERGASGPVVRDTKFLGGDDRLASLTQRFHDLAFPAVLPRVSRARLILRGALTCSAKTAKCEFTYERPRDLVTQRN